MDIITKAMVIKYDLSLKRIKELRIFGMEHFEPGEKNFLISCFYIVKQRKCNF